MIAFVADNHYGTHPGLRQYERLCGEYPLRFAEDDWSLLAELEECSLLILSLIGGSCGLPLPDAGCERAVRAYCQRGGNLLLLHGGSAAFWHWPWWRAIVGMRWVRPNDPDGASPSVHPVEPYRVEVCKCRHPLAAGLRPMQLPQDEIYTELEYTCPVLPLMQTRIRSGTFPQAYLCATPWGGELIGFLPGHAPGVSDHPELIANLRVLIEYLR